MMKEERLNGYAKAMLGALRQRRPDWVPYADNDDHKPEHLIVSVPSPSPDTPPLRISTEEDEIIVYFGQAHFHVGRRNADESEQVDALLTMLVPIFDEELIAAQFGSWLGFIAGGFVDKKEYDKRRRKGRLVEAVSWKGTFNFSRDDHLTLIRQ